MVRLPTTTVRPEEMHTEGATTTTGMTIGTEIGIGIVTTGGMTAETIVTAPRHLAMIIETDRAMTIALAMTRVTPGKWEWWSSWNLRIVRGPRGRGRFVYTFECRDRTQAES
jgi:hypothetical protein